MKNLYSLTAHALKELMEKDRLDPSKISEDVFGRIEAVDGRVKSAFDRLAASWPGRDESSGALNNAIADAVRAFGAAATESERAGIVCFACYRLRNSLLHLNEESLDVYQNLDLGVRMVGWALTAYRIARHREDCTLAGLR